MYIQTDCKVHIFGILLVAVLQIGKQWWRSWLRHCARSRKVAGSIPDETRSQYGPGFNSATNRNEYQEYF